MALKVEQLQLCVEEENIKNYSNVLKNQEKYTSAMIDVEDMAERYIAKLIPKSRRIYLPNVRYIENAKISYQKKDNEIIYEDKMSNSLNASLLDLIYVKTGMRFLLNEEKLNWLQPDNLRDTVNLIILYRLNNALQICLENFIVGICSLESLYKKLNVEILGISKEEFQKVVGRIEKDNFDKIQVFRTIFSNIDLMMRFYEYCWKNKQSKESGIKDEQEKTRAVVDRFFRNVERFYREYVNWEFEEKINNLVLRNSNDEKVVINISELYAELVQRGMEEAVSYEEKQKQDRMKEMMDSLNFIVHPDDPLLSVSTYLINKSPDNVMKNVKNMLHNMECYSLRNTEKDIKFTETQESLYSYYRRVVEYEIKNPKSDITKDMNEEYKNLVKCYSKYNEGK